MASENKGVVCCRNISRDLRYSCDRNLGWVIPPKSSLSLRVPNYLESLAAQWSAAVQFNRFERMGARLRRRNCDFRARVWLGWIARYLHGLAWFTDRVSVRLLPTSDYNGMPDSRPALTITQAAKALSRVGLAYPHVVENLPQGPTPTPEELVAPLMRVAFKRSFILNGGYAKTSAARLESARSRLRRIRLPVVCAKGGEEDFNMTCIRCA